MAFDWKKVGRAVADSAPVLGSLLGGPAGGAAGALIASTLGTAANPEAVLERIKQDPDVLLKIKQLEADERQHIRELQISTLQAELADVQSARTAHAGHWMPSAITMALTLMTVAVGIGLMGFEVPTANREMAVYLLGQITGLFTSAVSYWIGTSRSSANKDAALVEKRQ